MATNNPPQQGPPTLRASSLFQRASPATSRPTGPVVSAPALNPALQNVWQWDVTVGAPIRTPAATPYVRFIPESMHKIKFSENTFGKGFINQMRSNNRVYWVNCTDFEGNTSKQRNTKSRNTLRSLLFWILHADLKQIHLQVEDSFRVKVTKTTAGLIPFDDDYPLQALRTYTSDLKEKYWKNTLNEINLNAARGWYGPGTFPCRDAHCTKTGQCTTKSATVRWGPSPQQVVNVQHRTTCATNDIVYLLHCKACLALELSTTYIGRTNPNDACLGVTSGAHSRWEAHISQFSDPHLSHKYKDKNMVAIVVQMIKDGLAVDDDHICQDPFVHFNYIHTHDDRQYTILDCNFDNEGDRKRSEEIWKHAISSGPYNPATFSGSLNQFHRT